MFSAHPHFCALVMFWERSSQWFQEADSNGFSSRNEPVTPKHLNVCVYLNRRWQDKRPAHCLLLGRGVPRYHTRTVKHYQLSAWWGDSRNTPVCQRASRNSVNRLRIKEWKRWRVCVCVCAGWVGWGRRSLRHSRTQTFWLLPRWRLWSVSGCRGRGKKGNTFIGEAQWSHVRGWEGSMWRWDPDRMTGPWTVNTRHNTGRHTYRG